MRSWYNRNTGLLLIFIIVFLFSEIEFSLLEIIPIEKNEPTTSGAYKALDFWNQIRAYPGNDIPPAHFFKAYQKRIDEQSLLKKTNNADEWESIGPYNIPGRMISLAVNPQNSKTLYAGSASGGLWRTYDSKTGAGWHRVATGFPTLGIMAIAIDPIDTNVIYIGTGEVYGYQTSIGGSVIRVTRGSYGIGILKTTDGGNTWGKSLDWTFNQERGIQDIVINPLNNKSIIAATTEGIYQSVNSGNTWERTLNIIMGEDVALNPLDTNNIVVSCGNLGSVGSGIYYSTDAGNNWKRSTGLPHFTGKTLLDSFRDNPEILFASVANSESGLGLYKSVNSGQSWTRVHSQDVQSYQGFFAHWVAVHPKDQKRIVHAGVQIYRSANGGQSLIQVDGPHVDHHNYAHDPNNDEVLYIACDGGVYRSSNFGQSYTNIGYGLQTAQFYNGFASSTVDSNLSIGGLQDNNTAVYRGTKDWSRVIGGDGCWAAVNPQNDKIIFGEYQYNNIYRSVDGGYNFNLITNGLNGDGAAFVSPYLIAPGNPSVLYSGRRIIYKSTTMGESWFPTSSLGIDANSFISMAISSTNENILYAATAPTQDRAHVYKTTNGGNNWLNITGSLPDRYPMDIAVDPNNDNTVYIVFGGYNSGHIFKSVNAGVTWANITNDLPDVPTLSVIVDPFNSDHIYLGNDLGVFVSTNAGTSWVSFSEGLPEAIIAMDLNISNANRKLRVASHGNGAYQRELVFKPDFYCTMNAIDQPQTVIGGTELQFGLNIINNGITDQQVPLDLRVAVYDKQNNLLMSESATYCCLKPGELKNKMFDSNFTLSDIGEYKVEYIRFGNVQQPENDTLTQKIIVIETPSISKASVNKVEKTYSGLISPVLLATGDDEQADFSLPFPFKYDNYVYDQVQVSTNGWMEFGTGLRGSERGLSTAEQIGTIGANENGRLAFSSRPSKALGPWWDDLNADGAGKVGYKLQGLSPNRIIVVEWSNIRAYFDAASTTTRINFQVHLHESSNKIEFVYGPVVRGTFGKDEAGAMIGFKDHIGGDYHFFDIGKGGIGTTKDIVTNLSPLTDWPGENTAFEINSTVSDTHSAADNSPYQFRLSQNYPNPFNPETIIEYSVGSSKNEVENKTSLKIYNMLGEEIATLFEGVIKPGNYKFHFNGTTLPSGIYVYKIISGKYSDAKKMVLVK